MTVTASVTELFILRQSKPVSIGIFLNRRCQFAVVVSGRVVLTAMRRRRVVSGVDVGLGGGFCDGPAAVDGRHTTARATLGRHGMGGAQTAEARLVDHRQDVVAQ